MTQFVVDYTISNKNTYNLEGCFTNRIIYCNDENHLDTVLLAIHPDKHVYITNAYEKTKIPEVVHIESQAIETQTEGILLDRLLKVSKEAGYTTVHDHWGHGAYDLMTIDEAIEKFCAKTEDIVTAAASMIKADFLPIPDDINIIEKNLSSNFRYTQDHGGQPHDGIQILKSVYGYYIGSLYEEMSTDGENYTYWNPFQKLSDGYWPTREQAEAELPKFLMPVF